jgi:predicted ABC-class ATPase
LNTEIAECAEDAEKDWRLVYRVMDGLRILGALRDLGVIAFVANGTDPGKLVRSGRRKREPHDQPIVLPDPLIS